MCAKRVQAIVSGKVHGVGFRYFAVHIANRLELVGTVRNLPNGEVEAVAEGEENVLNDFIEALRKGPSNSRVDDLRAAWDDPIGQFAGFKAVA